MLRSARRALAGTLIAGSVAATVAAAATPTPSLADHAGDLAAQINREVGGHVQLAMVTATRETAQILSSQFDLTEHGRPAADGTVELGVVLHPGDAERLDALGFSYRIANADMILTDVTNRLAELDWMQSRPDPLRPEPGENATGYRTMAEYDEDMAALAAEYPDFVRLLELPNPTHEGRTVHALQIAGNPDEAFTDGRPMSILTGIHHAREWPSGELTIMFAYDVIQQYAAGNNAIVDAIDNTNFIVIPVVNPDGYVRSRETVSDFVAPAPGAAALAGEFAYHRKNMRDNGETVINQGVDPNRNYPYKWGGPGSDSTHSSATYHGPGPGSEPEVDNVLDLLRHNQVTTFITNHTFSDLVLRPFGDSEDDTPDEEIIKGHADAMAAINGYASIKGIELYATTGTTEDWIYGVTGAPGYTFEIGSENPYGGQLTSGGADCSGFHPFYFECVPQFYRLNRGAYLLNLLQARNTDWHSRLVGTAPAGTVLTLRKDVEIPLSIAFEGDDYMADYVETTMTVGEDGTFEWHVNQSPMPVTVIDVRDGWLDESDYETWTLTATLPDGTTTVVEDLLVWRGEVHEFAF